VVVAWVLFVPGSWITVRVLDGGDVAAVSWLVLYLAALSLALLLRFRSGAWRRIELVEPSA
jgi:MATE family multidrug resistance protein